MRHRLFACLVVFVFFVDMPAMAQTPANSNAAKAWVHPKTPWGDPDIQGLWPSDKLNYVPLQRSTTLGTRTVLTDEEYEALVEFAKKQEEIDNAEFATRDPLIARGTTGFLSCKEDPQRCKDGVRIGPPNYWDERGRPSRQASLVVEPANGRIPPLTPEAQKAAAERQAARAKRPCTNTSAGCNDSFEDASLWERCITRGVTSLWPGGYNKGNQIVQAPGVVVIRNEMIHENRVVWLDGRPRPPKSVVSYMGFSRGRWEGNTLVVETTNVHPAAAIAGANPSSEFLMVERFTRTGARALQYEATVTDEKAWTAPWKVSFPLELDPGFEIYEYACHEANYAMFNRLTGARAAEREEAEKNK